jgi:hypothetical protein
MKIVETSATSRPVAVDSRNTIGTIKTKLHFCARYASIVSPDKVCVRCSWSGERYQRRLTARADKYVLHNPNLPQRLPFLL